MKNIKALKRVFAGLLAAMLVFFVAGCGEKNQPTISDLQSEAKKSYKSQAQNDYKIIENTIKRRADLIPDFLEEEKDHTTLKFDERTNGLVLEAQKTVKQAKTNKELAEACTKLDEAIYLWLTEFSQLNPNTKDYCYLELYKKITDTSNLIAEKTTSYNKLAEGHNGTVSKEKDKLEKFEPPLSELLMSGE